MEGKSSAACTSETPSHLQRQITTPALQENTTPQLGVLQACTRCKEPVPEATTRAASDGIHPLDKQSPHNPSPATASARTELPSGRSSNRLAARKRRRYTESASDEECTDSESCPRRRHMSGGGSDARATADFCSGKRAKANNDDSLPLSNNIYAKQYNARNQTKTSVDRISPPAGSSGRASRSPSMSAAKGRVLCRSRPGKRSLEEADINKVCNTGAKGSRRQRYETTAYMDGAESMGMDILAEATVFSQISDPHLASNPLLQQPFEQDPRQKDWPEEAAQQQASLQEEQGQIHQGDRLNLLSAAVVSVVPDLETPTAERERVAPTTAMPQPESVGQTDNASKPLPSQEGANLAEFLPSQEEAHAINPSPSPEQVKPANASLSQEEGKVADPSPSQGEGEAANGKSSQEEDKVADPTTEHNKVTRQPARRNPFRALKRRSSSCALPDRPSAKKAKLEASSSGTVLKPGPASSGIWRERGRRNEEINHLQRMLDVERKAWGAAELVLPGAANQQQRVTRSVSAELQAAATAQQTPKESESSGQDDKRGEEGTDHHRWSEPASGGSNEVPCRNAAGIPADDIKKRPSPGPSQDNQESSQTQHAPE